MMATLETHLSIIICHPNIQHMYETDYFPPPHHPYILAPKKQNTSSKIDSSGGLEV